MAVCVLCLFLTVKVLVCDCGISWSYSLAFCDIISNVAEFSIYELGSSKRYKLVCAPIEDSDQTVQSDQSSMCVI